MSASLFIPKLCLVAFSTMDGPPAAAPRLIRECASSLRRLAATDEPLQVDGKLSKTLRSKSGREARSVYDVRIKMQGRRVKLEATPAAEDGQAIIYIARAEGFFAISRRPGSRDYFLLAAGNDTDNVYHHDYDDILDSTVRAPYCGKVFRLDQIMASPRFRARSIDPVERSGRRRMRLAFDYEPAEPDRIPLDGWVELDQSAGWALREFDVRYRPRSGKPLGASQIKGSVTYNQNDSSSPTIEAVHTEQYAPSGARLTYDFDVNKLTHDPMPEREFSLDQYGVDGYLSPSGRRTIPAGVLLVGAAIALLGVSAYLKYRTRRVG